jgi:hypothetical protein
MTGACWGWFQVVFGAALALLAHWPVMLFVDGIRSASDVPTDRRGPTPPGVPREGVPPEITGTFERVLAFTLALYADKAEVVGTVLAAWLGAKLAANWQRQSLSVKINSVENKRVRVYTLTALMGGVLSLAFGVAGGLVARFGLRDLGVEF